MLLVFGASSWGTQRRMDMVGGLTSMKRATTNGALILAHAAIPVTNAELNPIEYSSIIVVLFVIV